MEESGLSYLSYTASGVLSWGVANAAVFSIGFTLMQWRVDDILRMIRMSPAPLSAVLGSRYVLALGVGLVQSVLFVGVAMLPGFGLVPGVPVAAADPGHGPRDHHVPAACRDRRQHRRHPESLAGIANFLMLPWPFVSGSASAGRHARLAAQGVSGHAAALPQPRGVGRPTGRGDLP